MTQTNRDRDHNDPNGQQTNLDFNYVSLTIDTQSFLLLCTLEFRLFKLVLLYLGFTPMWWCRSNISYLYRRHNLLSLMLPTLSCGCCIASFSFSP